MCPKEKKITIRHIYIYESYRGLLVSNLKTGQLSMCEGFLMKRAVQPMPTYSLDCTIYPLIVWSQSCARKDCFIQEDRLECPSCGEAMRPEGGCRSGGTTSSSVWGIGVEMNGYDAG